MHPQYENRSAADFKNQKNDEKIFSDQIADRLSKEKQKTDFKDLVQPILATSAIPSFSEKEKIKQILLILKQQGNILISNNELKIDGHKYELHSFINDLLSHRSSFEYDIEPLISAMKKAKINSSLIPNPNIAKLLENKDKDKDSDNDTDNGIDEDDDDDEDYSLTSPNSTLTAANSSAPSKLDQIDASVGSSPSLHKSQGAISKIRKEESSPEKKIKNSPDSEKKRIKNSPGIAKKVDASRRSGRDTLRPVQYGKGKARGFKTWKKF